MKGVKIRIKSKLLKSRFEEVYFICHSMSINSGENHRQNQNIPLTLINQFIIDGIAIANQYQHHQLKNCPSIKPHFGGHLMFHRFWESEIALNGRSPVRA